MRIEKLFLLLLFFPFSFLSAQSALPIMDSRSAGMGGAFVSDSTFNPANLGFRGNILARNQQKQEDQQESEEQEEDTTSDDLNLRFNLFFSAEYVVSGGLLETADEVNDIIERNGGINQFQNSFIVPPPPANAQIQDGLRLINSISRLGDSDNEGAFTDIIGHVDFFAKNIGIYFNAWGHAGLEPIIDTNNLALSSAADFNTAANEIWGNPTTPDAMRPLSASQLQLAQSIENSTAFSQDQSRELVFQASQAGVNTDDPLFQSLFLPAIQSISNDGSTIQNNNSGILAQSFTMFEYNVSYGHSFLDIISLGVNLKIQQVQLFEEMITLQDIDRVEDILEDIRDGTYFDERVRRVERFNFDIGGSVRPLPGLSVSAYIKNIIPYSYRYTNGDTLDINTQFRIGASYTFIDMITVALDIDLNEIHYDTIDDYSAQMIGGGVEISPLPKGSPARLAFRVGGFKNVAAEDEDAVLTLGLGVQFWKFAVDAGGGVSWFKKVTVRSGGNDFDVFERASFAINISFDTAF